MQSFTTSRRGAVIVLVLLLLARLPVGAQTPSQPQNPPQNPPPQDQDEPIRVNTELVQATVTVLDKQGRFVEGLQLDQFELKVDGKPQPISFFERVTAGSASEESLLASARGKAPAPTEKGAARGLPDRGRTFFFFVDDLHMQADSMMRARKTILQFIERELGQNDQLVVSSASGQIGFLQQLTDNKIVLRAAVERLKHMPQTGSDMQDPPMSEYLALAIQERHDRDVLAVFMDPLLREMVPRDSAESMVRGRAEQILRQSTARTRNSLASLASLVRNAAVLPGRKVVFFLSDGFLLRTSDATMNDQLRSLTDAAARSGVVIYTADARGLSVDPSLDASARGIGDIRAFRAGSGELSAMQEPLRAIGEDTGGRALLNTNAIDAAITKTVKETSAYYVLAWQPIGGDQKGAKFRRLEVSVKGRPDLNVLAQRGFLHRGAEEQIVKAGATKPTAQADKPKTPAEELRNAIAAVYPTTDLRTNLTVNYVDTPKTGVVLTASVSVPYDALALDSSGEKSEGALDIEGHVYNAEGKSGSRFRDRVNVSPAVAASGEGTKQTAQGRRSVLYNHQVSLAPGLYQVRVAARDARSGRVGGATQWVEIPDLKAGRLALSSLHLGQRPPQSKASPDGANFLAEFSADHRFTRDSHLRFMTFIYNAAQSAPGAPPDLVIQIQIFRNDQPVVTDELRKVSVEGQDFSRVAYGAEIGLQSLVAGRYVLQVTAIDRVKKTSAAQRVNFTVE